MKKAKAAKAKKPTSKTNEKENTDEYYTEEEEKRIDKIHEQTGKKFLDEEVYDPMKKYKNDDEAIINELKERGENYQWESVGKSNYIFYNIILY